MRERARGKPGRAERGREKGEGEGFRPRELRGKFFHNLELIFDLGFELRRRLRVFF